MTPTATDWPTAKRDLWYDIQTYANTDATTTYYSNSKYLPSNTTITSTGSDRIYLDINAFQQGIVAAQRGMQGMADSLSKMVAAVSDVANKYRATILAKQRTIAPREFNRYVNASDLMEEFIREAGEHGATQADVLHLPIDLFIKWLVIRACEADQEDAGIALDLSREVRKPRPRCVGCGRYMRVEPVALCRPVCADRHFARRALVAA